MKKNIEFMRGTKMNQINSSVFVLLVILIGAGWCLFKIGVKLENDIKDTKGISEKVIELKTKVDLIYAHTNPRKLMEAKSPITLTDLGNEIAKKIEANKILEKNISKLTNDVEAESPKNAYDIQMVSIKIAKEKILGLLNEEELIKIKEEAYSRGILVEDIMGIFGILLRNSILSQKGMPISDVDKHTPGQQS